MADGVGENPEAHFAFTRNASGAQAEQFLFGLVGVADADVQMHLLWVSWVRPARRGSSRSRAGRPAGAGQARNR
jgi:hypothetical protein